LSITYITKRFKLQTESSSLFLFPFFQNTGGLFVGNIVPVPVRSGYRGKKRGRFHHHNLVRNNRLAGSRTKAIQLQGDDNLIEGATRNGIVLYKHPVGTGSAQDISIINNKAYKNGSAPNHGGGGIRIDFPGAKNVLIHNNTAYQNEDFQISIAPGSEAQLDSNLTQNP
jgi:hypothetical protein